MAERYPLYIGEDGLIHEFKPSDFFNDTNTETDDQPVDIDQQTEYNKE